MSTESQRMCLKHGMVLGYAVPGSLQRNGGDDTLTATLRRLWLSQEQCAFQRCPRTPEAPGRGSLGSRYPLLIAGGCSLTRTVHDAGGVAPEFLICRVGMLGIVRSEGGHASIRDGPEAMHVAMR